MRALVKKLTLNTPLFGVLQYIYIFWRRLVDFFIFKIKRPKSGWVLFTSEQLLVSKKTGFNSQFGQDIVLSKLFDKLWCDSKRAGYFVDVGANDPVEINNSLYFERAGWSGLAIDPIRRFQDAWKHSRKTTLISAAVSKTSGEAPFIEILSNEGWEHTLFGFAGLVRQGDIDIYGCNEYIVQTAPLSTLLPMGQKVDLLIIDVEGAEKLVLEGADLAILKPLVIMVENVGFAGGDNELRKIIEDFGYILVCRIGAADDVFLLKEESAALKNSRFTHMVNLK